MSTADQAQDGQPGSGRSGVRIRAHPVSWQVLVIGIFAFLITSIDRTILPTVLPAISEEFGLSEGRAGLLITLSFVGTFVGALVLGVLGDQFGNGWHRARFWVVCSVITIVASVASALTRSLGLFQGLRVLMGIGTGGMEPVNVAQVGEWWQKEDRGFALGAHQAGFPLGILAGPFLIAGVLSFADWRLVFLVIPLIAVPITIWQVVVSRPKNLERVNTWITEHRMTPSLPVEKVSRGGGAWGRVKEAMRHRNVRLVVAMNFCFLWAETAVSSFLTTQFTTTLGVALGLAAVLSGLSGATGWIGQVFWGAVSDRRGRKTSLNVLSVGWAVTVFSMMFIGSVTSAVLVMLAWGLFRNSPFPVAYALIMDTTPDAASSGIGLSVGLALGASGILAGVVTGYVIQAAGFGWSYAIIAGICLLALIPIRFLTETAGVGASAAA